MLLNLGAGEEVSLVCQLVKNPSAMWETWVQSLGWEDPQEKGMATHSSILPGEFHGQRSLGDYSPWDHTVRHDSVTEQQQSQLSAKLQRGIFPRTFP